METMRHPLVGTASGKIDLSRWRPAWYYAELTIGLNRGDYNVGSVVLDDRPFVLICVTSSTIGNSALLPAAETLWDAGQYTVEYRDENSHYFQLPLEVETLMSGSQTIQMRYSPPIPVPLGRNHTLHIRVTNRIQRIIAPEIGKEDHITVGVCFHGAADIGVKRRLS